MYGIAKQDFVDEHQKEIKKTAYDRWCSAALVRARDGRATRLALRKRLSKVFARRRLTLR